MGQHIPKSKRKSPVCFSPWLYKQRNLVERFFNKLKYCCRIATRYDKLGSAFLAIIKLACIRIRLRANESTVKYIFCVRAVEIFNYHALTTNSPGAA